LLVDEALAEQFLPMVAAVLSAKDVELRGDEETRKMIEAKAATEEDWSTEYLDDILAIKVVPSMQAAIDHINEYSSQHTEVIVTKNREMADTFLSQIDSACVFHNVSTRFSDGEEFGFGAEIGISTDKLHARGPMGLRELTSYQYRVRGEGQVKA
jgi:glutamate-5-semialdehyde dehydrogenase